MVAYMYRFAVHPPAQHMVGEQGGSAMHGGLHVQRCCVGLSQLYGVRLLCVCIAFLQTPPHTQPLFCFPKCTCQNTSRTLSSSDKCLALTRASPFSRCMTKRGGLLERALLPSLQQLILLSAPSLL